jgi:hypothetical protein
MLTNLIFSVIFYWVCSFNEEWWQNERLLAKNASFTSRYDSKFFIKNVVNLKMTINRFAYMSSRALTSKNFFLYAIESLETSEWDNKNKIVENAVDDVAC